MSSLVLNTCHIFSWLLEYIPKPSTWPTYKALCGLHRAGSLWGRGMCPRSLSSPEPDPGRLLPFLLNSFPRAGSHAVPCLSSLFVWLFPIRSSDDLKLKLPVTHSQSAPSLHKQLTTFICVAMWSIRTPHPLPITL